MTSQTVAPDSPGPSVLAERLAFLRAALANVTEGVVAVDAQANLVFVNEAATELLQRSSLPDLARLHDLQRPRDSHGEPIPAGEGPLSRALRGETVIDLHMRLARPDGSDVLVGISAISVHDESGQIVGAIAIFRDVDAALKMA